MATHKAIEDSYCLRDAEHVVGTNRYTFKFNMQWRNIIHERLTVSVRSVKLWLAPRHLYITGLSVQTKDSNISTAFDTTITHAMSEFNDKLANMFQSTGYCVYYNPTKKHLVFSCVDNNYFNYKSTSEMSSIEMSDDFKVITHSKSFTEANVIKTNAQGYITVFSFDNVWDRENVHVSSSFVDLGYHNFLGVSNEQFIPPKEYPISYTDHKFHIDLFDSSDEPVEIPSLDNKDTLLIELILNSYT